MTLDCFTDLPVRYRLDKVSYCHNLYARGLRVMRLCGKVDTLFEGGRKVLMVVYYHEQVIIEEAGECVVAFVAIRRIRLALKIIRGP